ncbi:MAG: hypothetical protein EB060_10455 [Proteobacteria bacterium]|nr:hypothetical protein [Pseudomonadota bacterium]
MTTGTINVARMREDLLDSLQYVGKPGVSATFSTYVAETQQLLTEYEQSGGKMTDYEFGRRHDAIRDAHRIPR